MLLTHRRPDQYYWAASMLSSKHVDGVYRGMLATLMAVFSVLQIASLFTPIGPRGAAGVAATVLVAGFCLAMAVMWARRSWPTRGQSKFFFLGTLAASVVTLLALQDPRAALLGTVIFAALGIYVAFFHGTGYLAVNFAGASLTVGVASDRLAKQDGIVAAASAFVFVLVVTVIVAVVCWTALRLLGNNVLDRDIDVSTGLSTSEAFYRGVSELIGARTRDGDRYIVFSAVVVDDLGLLAATDGVASQQRAQVAMAQSLQLNTRGSAVLTHLDVNVFVIAEVFSTAQLVPYAERLHGAVGTTTPRMNVSVGVVYTPLCGLATVPPEELAGDLIDAAVRQARSQAVPSIALYRNQSQPPVSDDLSGLGEWSDIDWDRLHRD